MNSLDPDHTAANGVHAAINGDDTAALAVHPAINGADNFSPPSPAADSPTTPVSTVPAPEVKIDLDYPEQESDVRNEPVDIKTASYDHVHEISVVSNPVSHDTPVDHPNDTPYLSSDDVNMGDHSAPQSNGINASHANGDIDMKEPPPPSAEASMASVQDASSPYSQSREREEEGYGDDEQPPAKRARILSDADKGSLTQSATPPPVSANVSNAASPAPPPSATATTNFSMASATPTPTNPTFAGSSTMSVAQFKFCQSCIRSLKKLKDAVPFLRPVDVVALNIPHYLSIVKHPMDFSTIERKINSSNPAKPDPNPQNPRYNTVDEFVADVRLVFTNCLTFNGPDHLIVQMGKRVEEIFDKQLKAMPPAEPSAPLRRPSPPPAPSPISAPIKKAVAPPVRRPSTSTAPVVRRDIPEQISRPKREIHPPPPKDLPYPDLPKKRKVRPVNETYAEQFKFCHKLLQDLHKKTYYNIAHPFYEPVDWVKMDLPAYPKIVKRPMDLSTMRKKLENHEYATPQRFHDDFKLMIKNCLAFNPIGTPVCTAGQQLQAVFDDKWRNLPPLRPAQVSDDDDDDDDDDSDADRLRAIAHLEKQIEIMRSNLEELKSAVRPKKDKKKKKEREVVPTPSVSRPIPKPQPKPAPPKKKAKKLIPDDDVLTFEQKKDLSETIGRLEGGMLEKVINIIHEGVPEIRDSTEEIEIEIDTLPAAVLTKLYNLVIRPTLKPAPKRNRTGKGTGTGGLKRKSMDEDVEAEKIRQLEERMALFEQGASGVPAPPPVRPGAGAESDSDSSSGSDSDSDSD